MKTRYFRAFWGLTEGATVEDKLRLCAEAGYDGIEAAPPDLDPAAWKDLCRKYNLAYVAQIYVVTAAEFREHYTKALRYGPVLVNAHSGRDKFTLDEGKAYFREVLKVEADGGTAVGHETHRHRIFYTPWTTAPYLEAFPELKITADFSHWTCVCESLLTDMADWVALACARAALIHGRVGWEEGPQVSDPRAPEFARYVETFERWWDAIRQNAKKRGDAHLNFTPEFGPPTYMPAQPYTQMPVVSLWDICLWMANRQRGRWKE